MLELVTLTLENFKTFKNTVEFNFDNIPEGLSFLTGTNLANPLLGANAVGKSSLTDAITWLLYGKTSRMLKAGNICNWETKKNCFVQGTFKKEGQLYKIIRTWNPNILQIELPALSIKTITQEELDLFLGMDFSSFLFSAHIAQFAPKFFELLPSEKLEVFTKILSNDLLKWDNFSEKSSLKLKTVEKEIYNSQLFKASLEGRIVSIPKISEEQINNWNEEQNNKKLNFLENIENKIKLINLLQIEIEALKIKEIQIDSLKQDKKETDLKIEQIQILQKEIENSEAELEAVFIKPKDLTEINKNAEQIELLQTQVENYKQIEEEILTALKEKVELKDKNKLEINNLEQIIKNLSKQITTIEVNCLRINKIILKLTGTTSFAQCPTCLQTVSKEHLLEEESKQKDELTPLLLEEVELNKNLKNNETLITTKKKILQKIELEEQELLNTKNEVLLSLKDNEALQKTLKNKNECILKDFNTVQERLKNKIVSSIKDVKLKQVCLNNEINTALLTFNNKKQIEKNLILNSFKELSNKKQYLENEISIIHNNIDLLKQEKNPVLLQKRKYEKILRILTKTLSYIEDEILNLKNEFEIIRYWVKGFSKIKLHILEETIKEVEIVINNILEKIGLVGWKISLGIGAETKAGTIKDGLSVFIKSPDNDTQVPFEVWSGGEGQRLALAGTLGIASFIRDKKSGGFNFICFDEPTQFLSPQGIEAFIETLKNYCFENKLKGILIDHRNLEASGDFNRIIKIIKDAEGSKIEIS